MKAPIQHRDAAEPEPSQAGGAQVSALGEMANRSPRVQQQKALNEMAAASPRANHTGLPDQLKAGVEALSGISMDHVEVHYNSARPAQLRALAYAQGSEIHLGPGQEQHLPHEAWHVVQQQQGRVAPTVQAKGVDINDDVGLEQEADRMGALAAQAASPAQRRAIVPAPGRPVLQALRLRRSNDKEGGDRAHPAGEGIDIETDDFAAFSKEIVRLSRTNPHAIHVIHAELLAAIGGDQRLRVAHQQHLQLLGEYMQSIDSAEALFDDERDAKEGKERARVEMAGKKKASAQAAIRGNNRSLPDALWTELFALDEKPAADILRLLNYACASKPGGERDAWLRLVLDGRYRVNIPVATLDCLLRSGAITLPIGSYVLTTLADACSAPRIVILDQALAVRGAGADQVAPGVSDNALCTFIFRQEATLAQLCLLNHAPARPYSDLMSIILAHALTAGEVQLIAALAAVPLAVCRSCIVDLRLLTALQAAALNAAAALLPAVDVAAFNMMCPLVVAGVAPAAMVHLTAYLSGTVLYPNLAHADLLAILQNNGAHAANMLQVFNARAAGGPPLVWAIRADLMGPGVGLNLHAPLRAGNWYFGREIISDMFGWRGAGGHGGYTFAAIEAARIDGLALIPLGTAGNQAVDVYVAGQRTRIVLNRVTSEIVTMFSI